MNLSRFLFLLTLMSATTAFAQTDNCQLRFFEPVNESVLVETEDEKVFRVCADKTIKISNMTFHVIEGTPLVFDYHLSWRVTLYHTKIEREVAGRATQHSSTMTYITKNQIDAYLETESLPFTYQINGETHSCNGVVNDIYHPEGRLNGQFTKEGILSLCNIKPTTINFLNQKLTIQDRVFFFPDGKLSALNLSNESTLYWKLPDSHKSVPVKGAIGFSPEGELRAGNILAPLSFPHNGQTINAESVRLSSGSRGPGVIYTIQGERFPNKLNGKRYLIEMSDMNDARRILEKQCRLANPSHGQFSFEYITSRSEFVQEESFYNLKNGELVLKQQETVYVPTNRCQFQFYVTLKDLAQYLP